MRIPAHTTQRLYRLAFASTLVILLGACAQQRESGYYQPASAGTASDAMHRAQDNNSVVAPSQIRLGFGPNTQKKPAQSTQPSTQDTSSTAETQAATTGAVPTPAPTPPAPLADTRTYLGTVPCIDGMQCPASRMTLTLAPDGQWRARSVALDTATAITRMGCWYVTDDKPLRIMLQVGQQTAAQLEFTSNNSLRILMVNGHRPLLDYNLTRQADIDPIAELSGQAAQNCSGPGA